MIDKDFLIQEYVKNGRTAKDIGKEIGKSGTQVLYWVDSHGLPKNKGGGSRNLINLTGKIFGEYTVLGKDNTRNSSAWQCKCSCGKIKSIKSQTLRANEARSCGGCKPRHNSKTYCEISGHYWARVKYGAKTRNFKFEITQEQAWNLYEKQHRKCALSGVDILLCKDRKTYIELQTASIDRIDSNKDYTIDNIQWVHKDVNRLKGCLDEKTFLDWVGKIYENCKINASR